MRLLSIKNTRLLVSILLLVCGVFFNAEENSVDEIVATDVVAHKVDEQGVFPPMFVMNLERSIDRWKMAQIQMAGEGLMVERFDAIDGRSLSTEELRNQSTRMAMFLQPRGVIGCYLSHRKFWQMVVDEGYESAIIFEDDVKLVPHFKEKLRGHLALLDDEKYDVVLLGKFHFELISIIYSAYVVQIIH